MATDVSTRISSPPDAVWMRERLDELCAFERASASDGELRAAEWLAGALRDEGVRDVRVLRAYAERGDAFAAAARALGDR